MTGKHFLTAALTLALLLTIGFPGSAAAADVSTKTPSPQELPGFSIKLIPFSGNGTQIRGYFSGYTSDMRDIQSYYSFDDLQYDPIDPDIVWAPPSTLPEGSVPSNTIAISTNSPLREYLAGEQDTFFIRLHYQTDSGAGVSQTAKFTRPTQVVPLPEDMTLYALYPSSIRTFYKAQYHLTLREGATVAGCRALLPDTLPIELQLMDAEGDLLAKTTVDCAVEWALPESLPEGDVAISAAVQSITPPGGMVLETVDALYAVDTLPPPSIPLTLKINRVGSEDRATPALYCAADGSNNYPADSLYLNLPLKPSGAQAILPSYSLDGGSTWTAMPDLLSYNEPVDAYPKNPDYRYALLFSPEQSPYREYLSGGLDGFLIQLDIVGGTFAGQSETAAWPLDYQYQPPSMDNGDNGSGGNGGNIGSDQTDGNSGENGGQRPHLPVPQPESEELVPEQTLPPVAESKPVSQPISEPAAIPLSVTQPKAAQPVGDMPTEKPLAEDAPTGAAPAEGTPTENPTVPTVPVETEPQPPVKQSSASVPAASITLAAAGGGAVLCLGFALSRRAGGGAKLLGAIKRWLHR